MSKKIWKFFFRGNSSNIFLGKRGFFGEEARQAADEVWEEHMTIMPYVAITIAIIIILALIFS